MIVDFNTNDPPKILKSNINKRINSKTMISDYMSNYMISDNNLTSFIVKEDIV